jgi:hypothetical protein
MPGSPKKGKPGRTRGKDSERSRSPSRQRASKGAKKRQGTNDFTLEEMMDRIKKIGKFFLDPKTGVGTLEVLSKRLMNEDVELIIEIIKRYTEIQNIKLSKCFITDDIFIRIHENGLVNLRHLKSLQLPFNMLSK